MRLTAEVRKEAENELKHWGYVARKRWRAEPRQKHIIAKMMELGENIPTGYYSYDYEPDAEFKATNEAVMRIPSDHRVALIFQYIDCKPWKRVYKEFGLESMWQMKSLLRRAVNSYVIQRDEMLINEPKYLQMATNML